MPIDPLSQLRDVILPPPPGWWPPAFGWWLLIIAIIVVLSAAILIGRRLRRHYQTRSPVDDLDALLKLQPRKAVTELSILMRRIAITQYSRPAVAGLCGEAWLEFLDKSGNTQQFTRGPGRALVSAPYSAVMPEHLEPLFDVCRNWVKTVTH